MSLILTIDKFKKYGYLSVIFLSIIVTGCTKDDGLENKSNSIVETLTYTLLPEGGVNLSGNLNNANSIITYGFVISRNPDPTLSLSEIRVELNDNAVGRFNANVTGGMESGTRYFFKAYAHLPDGMVYGEEKTFISNGNALPLITQTIPAQAHLLDTLGIKGSFYSKDVKVFFNEKQTSVISRSDSLITCVIPASLPIGEPIEYIRILQITGEESFYDDFSLYTPVIDSISPRIAYETDTLIFYGKHFDFANNRNVLAMKNGDQNQSMQVLESSRTKLVVKNNQGTFFDENPSFTLLAQQQIIYSDNQLSVLKPELTGSNDCAFIEDDFVVFGSNLPLSARKINIGSQSFDIKRNFKDSLFVDMKNGVYKDFTLENISLPYANMNITLEKDICIGDSWIYIGTESPSFTISYEGEVYGLVRNFAGQAYIGKLNTETNKFERISRDVFPPNVFGTLKTVNGTKFYTYMADQTIDRSTFLSYDIFTEQVTLLSKFPGNPRGLGLIVSHGDYIYMGLGRSVFGDIYRDIWRYSVIENTWEKVIDVSEDVVGELAKETPLSFSHGNSIYFGTGERAGDRNDLWAMDTQSNTLTRKSNIPTGIAGEKKVVVIGDKMYFDHLYFYEYDIINDSWQVNTDIIFPNNMYEAPGSIFQVEGTIYRSIMSLYGGGERLFKLNPALKP